MKSDMPSADSPKMTGAQEGTLLAIVRIRSGINRSRETLDALKVLRLERIHSAVLLRPSPSLDGQMMKIKDVACWGPIDKQTLLKLLVKRGRLVGDRRLSEPDLKRYTGYSSVEALVEDLRRNKVDLAEVKGLKPFFRLMPRGLRASRKSAGSDRGLLGNLGKGINELLMRML
jgi:large subunit ribosomal protein L30